MNCIAGEKYKAAAKSLRDEPAATPWQDRVDVKLDRFGSETAQNPRVSIEFCSFLTCCASKHGQSPQCIAVNHRQIAPEPFRTCHQVSLRRPLIVLSQETGRSNIDAHRLAQCRVALHWYSESAANGAACAVRTDE